MEIKMEIKKIYIKPHIEWIPLDNEISLALQSEPPIGPEEFGQQYQQPFSQSNDPFFG